MKGSARPSPLSLQPWISRSPLTLSGEFFRPNLIFERVLKVFFDHPSYLFHLSGNDGAKVRGWMATFKETSQFAVDDKLLAQAKVIFSSCSVSDDEVCLPSFCFAEPVRSDKPDIFSLIFLVIFRPSTVSGDIRRAKGWPSLRRTHSVRTQLSVWWPRRGKF